MEHVLERKSPLVVSPSELKDRAGLLFVVGKPELWLPGQGQANSEEHSIQDQRVARAIREILG